MPFNTDPCFIPPTPVSQCDILGTKKLSEYWGSLLHTANCNVGLTGLTNYVTVKDGNGQASALQLKGNTAVSIASGAFEINQILANRSQYDLAIGAISITGGTSPTGITGVYSYSYAMNSVTVSFVIDMAGAGTANTDFDFILPASLPIPRYNTSTATGENEHPSICLVNNTDTAICFIERTSASINTIRGILPSTNTSKITGSITYISDTNY